MLAVVSPEYNGIEGVKVIDIPLPDTMTREDLYIKTTFIGINEEDIEVVNGSYPMRFTEMEKQKNKVIGLEAVGFVVKAGSDVTRFRDGDMVICPFGPCGCFAENIVKHRSLCMPLTVQTAPQLLVGNFRRAIMAQTLLLKVIEIAKGQTILVHDADLPMEQILCKMAVLAGLKVIGTVKTESAKMLATASGCALVINYKKEPIVEAVRSFTNGNGVHAVFDGCGKEVFDASIKCMKVFATYIHYRHRSGKIDTFNPFKFAQKSLYFVAPLLEHYKNNRAEFGAASSDIFDLIRENKIMPQSEVMQLNEIKKAMEMVHSGYNKPLVLQMPS
jgi:NADPH2:quinone reductase